MCSVPVTKADYNKTRTLGYFTIILLARMCDCPLSDRSDIPTHTHLIRGQVNTQVCHLFSRAQPPSFLSRHKVLKSLGGRGSRGWCNLRGLRLGFTYSKIRTCSGSAWAWILSLSDGVSTVPGKTTLIYPHISIAGWWGTETVVEMQKKQTTSVLELQVLSSESYLFLCRYKQQFQDKTFNVQDGLPDAV